MDTIDENRPYPEGIAWDEAWRQRQRAEESANTLISTSLSLGHNLNFQKT